MKKRQQHFECHTDPLATEADLPNTEADLPATEADQGEFLSKYGVAEMV